MTSSRERMVRAAMAGLLVLIGSMAIAGPSGVLAWGRNVAQLEQRETEISALESQRDELKNRVALLNPEHADPDLVGELLRRNLNVAHPDEVVIVLDR